MYAILSKLTRLHVSTIPLQKRGDCRLSFFSHVGKPHIAFLDAHSLFLFRERKKDVKVRKWKVSLYTSERTYHKLTAHFETTQVCCFCLLGGHIRAFYYWVYPTEKFSCLLTLFSISSDGGSPMSQRLHPNRILLQRMQLGCAAPWFRCVALAVFTSFSESRISRCAERIEGTAFDTGRHHLRGRL